MKRCVLLVMFTCTMSLVSPAPASASLMDWLQELSGPGPFNAKKINVILDICPTSAKVRKEADSPKYFASDYDTIDSKKPRICGFIDYRSLANDGEGDNFGAGAIDVKTWEFGASARLHRSVSVGFGAGYINFKTQTPQTGVSRFLVTAPRVVFKPALIFGSDDFWKAHKPAQVVAGLFKFYIKNNIISGRLTGANFGLVPGHPNYSFAVRHDRVWSSGFVIDLTDLLALW